MRSTESQSQNSIPDSSRKIWLFIFVTPVLMFLVGVFAFTYTNTPPSTFPIRNTFVIPEGSGVGEIAELLEEHDYIRSALLFKLLVRVQFEQPLIQAGGHTFSEPLAADKLIEVLTAGVAPNPLHTVTFPEGFSVYDINNYINDTFAHVDVETLRTSEGYLFPETYFVSSYETFEELTLRMHDEYEKNIAPLREKIKERGFTEDEVITLASILEREANDTTSMRMVSGILQNRLTEGLPLQVDATFAYILGKTSAELTLDDLKMESPYNTYTNIGLPPTPIANPGLVAIQAVLDPTPSEYFYYLTGSDGNFYYAKDFEGHKRNKAHYLR